MILFVCLYDFLFGLWVGWLVCSFVGSLVRWSVGSLVRSFVGSLVRSLFGWMVGLSVVVWLFKATSNVAIQNPLNLVSLPRFLCE